MLLNERILYLPWRLGITLLGIGVFPDNVPVPVVQFPGGIRISVGTVNLFHFSVGTTVDLSGGTMCPHTVVIQIFDAEEVVLVAGYPPLATTPAGRLDRILAEVPVHDVYFVNELFGDVVA